tara:strand:+ start:915 stop:1181 length:267 start_codon:yes stop_codon:yes gene_type:complete
MVSLKYETEDYYIDIGESLEEPKQREYKVYNKKTGVVEYSDYLLPRVIDSMLQMQEKLVEVVNKFNESVKADNTPKLTVIGNGENSLH